MPIYYTLINPDTRTPTSPGGCAWLRRPPRRLLRLSSPTEGAEGRACREGGAKRCGAGDYYTTRRIYFHSVQVCYYTTLYYNVEVSNPVASSLH